MTLNNDLILRTARGEKVERPPIWIMRQAGRILPQYRKLRASVSGFKALIKDPQLAAEVTVQPVDELDVDAAILFSDILVIPEAMGLDYDIVESKGPRFSKTIVDYSDIEALITGDAALEKMDYVFQAVSATKKALDNRVPLIGFCGAPWTIMCYMLEGQGSKTFSKVRAFLYRHPDEAHQLLQKIATLSVAYLKTKIDHGVQMVQIFDSWASILSPSQYKEFGCRYIKQMADQLTEVPCILFAKGAAHSWADLASDNAAIIGTDWSIETNQIRAIVGENTVVQGNLDPCLLYASEAKIEHDTALTIEHLRHRHIVNLGHGVYPDTPLSGVKSFVNFVKNYRYN